MDVETLNVDAEESAMREKLEAIYWQHTDQLRSQLARRQDDETLNQFRNYFRNKYWIGVSQVDDNTGFFITKGDGARICLNSPKSYVELFMEIERLATLEI